MSQKFSLGGFLLILGLLLVTVGLVVNFLPPTPTVGNGHNGGGESAQPTAPPDAETEHANLANANGNERAGADDRARNQPPHERYLADALALPPPAEGAAIIPAEFLRIENRQLRLDEAALRHADLDVALQVLAAHVRDRRAAKAEREQREREQRERGERREEPEFDPVGRLPMPPETPLFQALAVMQRPTVVARLSDVQAYRVAALAVWMLDDYTVISDARAEDGPRRDVRHSAIRILNALVGASRGELYSSGGRIGWRMDARLRAAGQWVRREWQEWWVRCAALPRAEWTLDERHLHSALALSPPADDAAVIPAEHLRIENDGKQLIIEDTTAQQANLDVALQILASHIRAMRADPLLGPRRIGADSPLYQALRVLQHRSAVARLADGQRYQLAALAVWLLDDFTAVAKVAEADPPTEVCYHAARILDALCGGESRGRLLFTGTDHDHLFAHQEAAAEGGRVYREWQNWWRVAAAVSPADWNLALGQPE